MKAMLEILVMSLASLAASTPRMGWTDVCSYSDPVGNTCCSPGMENKEYLVVPENHDWFGHSLACTHYGGGRGGLAVFEEPEEGSCVQHYVLNAWKPSYQRFAISLRHPFTMPGIYHWIYPNGSLVQPHYTEWQVGHPIDRGCVTMLLGDGVVHQGEWIDGDCVEDTGLFSVCEREKICAFEGGSCTTDHDCCGDLSCDVGTCRQPVSGLIISGGEGSSGSERSVEVYVPSTGHHCQLPDLPDNRVLHSQEEVTVCGGWASSETLTSCLSLDQEGTWQTSARLQVIRDGHTSWASKSGLMILGGGFSPRSTERILEDGSSSFSFDLGYDTDMACAINLGSSVIITGQDAERTKVTQYNEAGYVRDLPLLQRGRVNHGCSYYNNGDGTKTLLVSGGVTSVDSGLSLSSTELLVGTAASAWVWTGEIPSPRAGLRGANIDSRVLMTGGYIGGTPSDDILEFQPLSGQWKVVDRMNQARRRHSVSVINFADLFTLCLN